MSGGQQQRLCIARALAIQPEVLLMDEPTSALDPISPSKIEDLALELSKDYTIIMVTHNMQQAARVSDQTAFFNLEATGKPGQLVEIDDTEKIFSNPTQKATEDYISPLKMQPWLCSTGTANGPAQPYSMICRWMKRKRILNAGA